MPPERVIRSPERSSHGTSAVPTRSRPPPYATRVSAWVIEHVGARPEPDARLRAVLGKVA